MMSSSRLTSNTKYDGPKGGFCVEVQDLRLHQDNSKMSLHGSRPDRDRDSRVVYVKPFCVIIKFVKRISPPWAKKALNVFLKIAMNGCHHIPNKMDNDISIKKCYRTPLTRKSFLLRKGEFSRKRCFIIGTAPSINGMDLSLLRHDCVFSVNRGYLLLERGLHHINFYALSDQNAIKSYGKEINPGRFDHFFLISGVQWKKPPLNMSTFSLYNKEARAFSMCNGFFQFDIKHPLAYSSTVVLHQLQIAVWLGFNKIYFVGVDNDFSGNNMHFYKDTKQEKEHMAGYVPPVELNDQSFMCAEKILRKQDIRIFNATVGGRLNAIPRVEYLSLFSGTNA